MTLNEDIILWLDGVITGGLLVAVTSPLIFFVMGRVKDKDLRSITVTNLVIILVFCFLNSHAIQGKFWASVVFFPFALLMPFMIWSYVAIILQPKEVFMARYRKYLWGTLILHIAAIVMDHTVIEQQFFKFDFLHVARLITALFFGSQMILITLQAKGTTRLPPDILKRRRIVGFIAGYGVTLFCVGSGIGLFFFDVASESDLIMGRVLQNSVLLVGVIIYEFIASKNMRNIFMPKNTDISSDSDKDLEIRQKIKELFEEKEAFRNASLTAGMLAKQIGLTEIEARSFLQEKLGFRNFNDFVNEYRVHHAAKLLTSHDYQHQKISAIAFECGFNSISPFNRAFQKTFKKTPSSYRQDNPAA